jgi:hypothetical protein
MRAAGVVFGFVFVFAACGGPETLPWNYPEPDCAPVGDYTCTCVEFLDTCGVSLDVKRSATVDDATELCGSTRRLEDSGWYEVSPGQADTCWFRSQSELRWQAREPDTLDLHIVVKATCPGKAPCGVELLCSCQEKNP